MKIEKFEDYKKLKVGDYVVCVDNARFLVDYEHDELNYYIVNNVGQIIAKNEIAFDYIIMYDNIPQNMSHHFSGFGYENARGFMSDEIIKSSENKSELELYIFSKKYNI